MRVGASPSSPSIGTSCSPNARPPDVWLTVGVVVTFALPPLTEAAS